MRVLPSRPMLILWLRTYHKCYRQHGSRKSRTGNQITLASFTSCIILDKVLISLNFHFPHLHCENNTSYGGSVDLITNINNIHTHSRKLTITNLSSLLCSTPLKAPKNNHGKIIKKSRFWNPNLCTGLQTFITFIYLHTHTHPHTHFSSHSSKTNPIY